MQFSFKFIALLFSSIVFEYGLCQRYEGDSCSLYFAGPIGVCIPLRFCQSAIQAIQIEPINLQTCGFNNYNELVVCCAHGLVRTSNTRVPFPRRRGYTPTTPILEVGNKSRQKCKEYSGGFQSIYGGKQAESHEFLHMALIGYEKGNDYQIDYSCGGSLISERFVLSAAHCTYHNIYGRAKYVLLGELVLDSDTDDANPQRILIKNIISHPDYQYPSRYHDIALFELEHQPKLDRIHIKPACLNTNPRLTDRQAVATGWGSTAYSDMSKELQKVTLDIFTTAECNDTYRRNFDSELAHGIDEQIQMCAGSRHHSKDTCQGDSGGPLQIRDTQYSDMYDIIGITSFGKTCGFRNVPGVYTRVSAYIQWIENIVWP